GTGRATSSLTEVTSFRVLSLPRKTIASLGSRVHHDKNRLYCRPLLRVRQNVPVLAGSAALRPSRNADEQLGGPSRPRWERPQPLFRALPSQALGQEEQTSPGPLYQ